MKIGDLSKDDLSPAILQHSMNPVSVQKFLEGRRLAGLTKGSENYLKAEVNRERRRRKALHDFIISDFNMAAELYLNDGQGNKKHVR